MPNGASAQVWSAAWIAATGVLLLRMLGSTWSAWSFIIMGTVLVPSGQRRAWSGIPFAASSYTFATNARAGATLTRSAYRARVSREKTQTEIEHEDAKTRR